MAMKSVLLALMVFVSLPARADFPRYLSDYLSAKQTKKSETRWTLVDWLDMKNRISLMDQWLALNSTSNLFEIFFGGGYHGLEHSSDSNAAWGDKSLGVQHYDVGLFVSILGFEHDWELYDKEEIRHARGHLRLLGVSEQSSSLSVHYGQRAWKMPTVGSFENPYWGGALTLYLFRHIGIKGEYSLFEAEKSQADFSSQGNRWEGSFFIEAQFLRVIFTAFEEQWKLKGAAVHDLSRKGLEAAVKMYF